MSCVLTGILTKQIAAGSSMFLLTTISDSLIACMGTYRGVCFVELATCVHAHFLDFSISGMLLYQGTTVHLFFVVLSLGYSLPITIVCACEKWVGYARQHSPA